MKEEQGGRGLGIHLTEGVDLHLVTDKKYKTIRVKIKFTTALTETGISARALMAALLETNSKKYPSQTALRRQLSSLYGAGFAVNAEKLGKLSVVTVEMSLVNELFLPGNSRLFEKGMEFLREVLLRPNITDGAFDDITYRREKENLMDQYDAYYDDKQFYAGLALQQLYFTDSLQQMPWAGTKETLNVLTNKEIHDAYTNMITKDKIDVFVTGEINEKTVVEQIRKFGFEKRERKSLDAQYHQKKSHVIRKKEETQQVVQAQLNLMYQTGIYYHEEQFYAAQVLNGLFGGFPHSKLFINVREKEGLAYSACSSLDPFRGTLTVQTGIDPSNAKRVEAIIAEQLADLQKADIEPGLLEQTKTLLISQLKESQDDPGTTLELIYAQQLTDKKNFSFREWNEQIQKVQIEDVVKAASSLSLQAVYLLKGEEV